MANVSFLRIDAEALNVTFRRRCESAEPQAEVLDLLRRRFLAPHTVALQAQCGEGRGLEAQDFAHLIVQMSRCTDDPCFSLGSLMIGLGTRS